MQKSVAQFAAAHVASRSDLISAQHFPADLWRAMGKAGLFQIGISEAYGGSGGGYPELVSAGEALVRYGLNLGVAFSWAYQQIIARCLIDRFAPPQLKQHLMPKLAEGDVIVSFAVSEPGHGAHPKKLQTRAVRRHRSFVLDGEKTYLTNGPMADLFIVIAVTDADPSCRRLTAFLVDRRTPGVTLPPPMAMRALKTSPHGGLRLNACLLPSEAVLGPEGNAWMDMVIPMGEIEDIAMMGPVLGGMEAQMDALIQGLAVSHDAADRELYQDLGRLQAILQTLRLIAADAAARLEKTGEAAMTAAISFARLVSDFQDALGRCLARRQVEWPEAIGVLKQDVEFLGRLRQKLLQIRQEKIGAALLASR